MKYFKMIAITAMMALATISCTKSPMFEPEMPEPLDQTAVFSLDLAFDANVQTAEVFFYDADGVQVSAQTFELPSGGETITTSFVSESSPEYIYSEGLQNGGSNGMISIPASSIETKAGGRDPILLVIRR